MVHLTRCLECERSRDRKETFLDISIAVKHLKAADADDSLGEEEEGQFKNSLLNRDYLALYFDFYVFKKKFIPFSFVRTANLNLFL